MLFNSIITIYKTNGRCFRVVMKIDKKNNIHKKTLILKEHYRKNNINQSTLTIVTKMHCISYE
jgi:hypothetical protein